ncbi:MAG: hypothetical protein H0V12_10440 [Chloroflexi bacterium]|nr:hypothetical protein [Chloroflexota bacterium]
MAETAPRRYRITFGRPIVAPAAGAQHDVTAVGRLLAHGFLQVLPDHPRQWGRFLPDALQVDPAFFRAAGRSRAA